MAFSILSPRLPLSNVHIGFQFDPRLWPQFLQKGLTADGLFIGAALVRDSYRQLGIWHLAILLGCLLVYNRFAFS